MVGEVIRCLFFFVFLFLQLGMYIYIYIRIWRTGFAWCFKRRMRKQVGRHGVEEGELAWPGRSCVVLDEKLLGEI